METTTGIWAKWLFEVGWVMSAEVPKDANDSPVNAAGQPIDADGTSKSGGSESTTGTTKTVEGGKTESIIKFLEVKPATKSGGSSSKGGGK